MIVGILVVLFVTYVFWHYLTKLYSSDQIPRTWRRIGFNERSASQLTKVGEIFARILILLWATGAITMMVLDFVNKRR